MTREELIEALVETVSRRSRKELRKAINTSAGYPNPQRGVKLVLPDKLLRPPNQRVVRNVVQSRLDSRGAAKAKKYAASGKWRGRRERMYDKQVNRRLRKGHFMEPSSPYGDGYRDPGGNY